MNRLRPYAQLVRLPNVFTALADIALAALATHWEREPGPGEPAGKRNKGEVECKVVLDATKAPKEMTLTGVKGPGAKVLGIYKLDKDTLTLASFTRSEVKRPKGFSPKDAGDDDLVLLVEVFERAKPAKK
jgi:uncharacterized protein (TIGR03067 family)